MSIEKTEIEKVAKLAKLRLEATAGTDYQADLSAILDLVQQMQAVDTDGVAPLAHPLDITARLRPDVVTETDQREQLQRGAALVEAGHYLVPKVIE
ncbi:MAG: Asp-tRNA(Asn)/Glu-tRNA(Gln) amidotransferase subunit GatC [Gammaproteobacteria bacterium]